MNRREFIALTSAFPLATSIATAQTDLSPAPQPATKPAKGTPQIPPIAPVPGPACLMAGPMLGHLAGNEASLWIQTTAPSAWSVEIADNPDFHTPRLIQGTPTTAAAGLNSQLHIADLKPGTRYHYRVLCGDRIVSPLPAAAFVTPPVVGTPGRVRAAFSSCVGRLPEHAAAAWGEIAARPNLDLFLMLGDNHYADSTDLTRQRLYYTAHRRDPGFRDFTSRLPLYGIWDDHDYGPNDSDTTATGKENSLQAFREFWANPPRPEEPADPAIYYHFQRGEVGFLMLDVRWHRAPDKAPDGPGKSMLGATQLDWLKRTLKASTAKVHLIASGSEWQTHGHQDSWAMFRTERDALLAWLDAEKIPGVIFISGDRHFAAGYQIRDRWIELTGGPLGSTNQRDATAATSAETFTVFVTCKMWIILDIDTTAPEPAVAYEIWGAGEGLIERREFTWNEVQGLAKIQPGASVARLKI